MKSTFCAPPATVSQLSELRGGRLRAQLRDPARASSQPEPGARTRRPLCRRSLVYVCARAEPHSGARHESPQRRPTSPIRSTTNRGSTSWALTTTCPSFSTWQMTRSHDLSFPALHQSAGTTHLATRRHQSIRQRGLQRLSRGDRLIRRRMTSGLYFRLAYTFAHAYRRRPGRAGRGPSVTVQNSYSTSSERGPSVTDQRHRFVLSAIESRNPSAAITRCLRRSSMTGRSAGVLTIGSGRPVDAKVFGDPNQDGNTFERSLARLRTQRISGSRLCDD